LTTCPTNACGTWSDGCGGTLECGGCSAPKTCSGTTQGYCGCARKTCAQLGVCGNDIDDGCGGKLRCSCDAPNTCGADGQCACVKLTCAELGHPNGEAYDGCGGFMQCSGSGSATENVRILAGNLTSSGSLTTSAGASVQINETWDAGHGLRVLQGLKPEVALLQEFKTLFYEYDRTGYWTNSDAALRDFVQTAFGDRYFAYRENRTGRNMGKPNGIVSYYPIKEAGEIPSALSNIQDRQHVWARIDIPGSRDLWVVSVHLYNGGGASDRDTEAKDLVQKLKALDIPSTDFLVIGGDFNTNSRGEKAYDTLGQLIYVENESSSDSVNNWPTDQSGNGDTNKNRDKSYDAVLVNTLLKNYQTRVVIGSASSLKRNGLVFDSRRFTPLSAVSPIQKNDMDAMQHMAVIKDFDIPR
jgi:endonuclease/exonuclease/phosphatase family metal-dependent hydrolase